MLIWLEIRRSKLRFILLTSTIALIAFLMIFLSALSVGLISSVSGAINGLNTDLMVFSSDSRANLQASRLSPDQVLEISETPGVTSAAPLATTTVSTTADFSTGGNSLQLFATPTEGAGTPSGLVAGRLPDGPGEIAIDAPKVEIGATIQVVDGSELTVVGLMKGAQFAALPTAYATFATYSQVFRAVTPGAAGEPINAVAVNTDGSNPEVAASIANRVQGVAAYQKSEVAAAIPGASSIRRTFGMLIVLCLISGVVVIGFFFLIMIVSKVRSLTVLRAIGASTRSLAGVLFGQITVVVLVGGVVGFGLALGAISGMSASIPVAVTPQVALGCGLAILLGAYLAGLVSLRRIVSIEPASALTGGGNQ